MGMRLVAIGLAVFLLAPQRSAPGSQPQFDRVYPLKAEESVFAYARIAPNGRWLAYASQMPIPGGRGITQTVTVVDLQTKAVLFTEAGIDAYWSNDNARMIYLSFANPRRSSVAIRHHPSGLISRDVAPVSLGDYFSWSVRDGVDTIMTIQSNFYALEGDKGVLPAKRPPPCPGIGVGERPLISKDGRRASTFANGAVVFRNVDDCERILDTGLQGAKADWSFDGRYVAFHVAKKGVKSTAPASRAYDLVVVDAERRTVRTLSLPGSSLFPSWTADGRLCFRYDGDDYRGFMMARDVLAAPESPLPAPRRVLPEAVDWATLFPETPKPSTRATLAMVWAAWSAHSPYALQHLQQAASEFRSAGLDATAVTAVEISSRRDDVERLRRESRITLPEIPLAAERLPLTAALNQIPTTLLFVDGRLTGQRLGAQAADELREWVRGALHPKR